MSRLIVALGWLLRGKTFASAARRTGCPESLLRALVADLWLSDGLLDMVAVGRLRALLMRAPACPTRAGLEAARVAARRRKNCN